MTYNFSTVAPRTVAEIANIVWSNGWISFLLNCTNFRIPLKHVILFEIFVDLLRALVAQLFRVEENGDQAVEDGTNAARQVLELEREALVLRKELQETRAKKEEADQKLLQ